MRCLYLLLVLFISSCTDKKTLLLPEIKNAKITEVLDVSPAYIFYDESQPDSTLLNRKNLISTTNWLVNVDKRLTLKQAMPHIQFLQNKKRNAKMHKNENAKNYFTCNDTSIENLGFLEFTNVFYKYENPDFILSLKENPDNFTMLKFFEDGKLTIYNISEDAKIIVGEKGNVFSVEDFNPILKSLENKVFVLLFQQEMSFQNYITVKSGFNAIDAKGISLSENEYLFD